MKKYLLMITFLILTIIVGCSSKSPLKYTDDSDSNQKPSNELSTNYSDFQGLDLPEDKISIQIDGNPLNIETPIYLDKNRYYLCLNELIEKLNGKIELSDSMLSIKLPNTSFTINTSNNIVTLNKKNYNLKKSLLNKDNFYYISFSDLNYIFNFYTKWDIDSKTIFCKTNGFNNDNITPYISTSDKVGYLRLEDISLTTLSYDKEFLEKLRIMGNFLGEKQIPYHIAWIPRFVSPSNNIDIDLTSKNDFQAAELIYTLDFLTQHNGYIGLHGYTHQCGNEESAIGSEFGPKYPSSKDFREKIEKALKVAKYLAIPIDFFETPHYEITAEQNKIAEEYFKILYYPFKDNGPKGIDYTKPQLSPYNHSSYYISTPIDYVRKNNTKHTLDIINNLDSKKMGSLFYHPRLDFPSITLSNDNNIPSYIYNDDSPLKQVIAALEKKGYKMSSVKDIK